VNNAPDRPNIGLDVEHPSFLDEFGSSISRGSSSLSGPEMPSGSFCCDTEIVEFPTFRPREKRTAQIRN
jgi:hypothetical protein